MTKGYAVRLGEIAEIKTGLVLNRKQAVNKEKSFKYNTLTLKSLKKNGVIDNDELDVFLSGETLNDNYLTHVDDIVLRLSEPNTVTYINEKNTNILVPSQFCILRRKNRLFNFEFLAWYLNSEAVKKRLKKSSIGSTLPIVTTGYLNELSIDKIPIEKQAMVVEIVKLKNREFNLMESLISEKDKLYNGLIDKILKTDKLRGKNDKTRKN